MEMQRGLPLAIGNTTINFSIFTDVRALSTRYVLTEKIHKEDFMIKPFRLVAVLSLLFILTGCSDSQVKPFNAGALHGELKGTPVVLASHNALNLVWEMSITDFRDTDTALVRIDVVESETGHLLDTAIFGTTSGEYSPTLWFPPWTEEPKFFFWLRLEPEEPLPAAVLHRLTFRTAAGMDEVVELCPFVPEPAEPTVLSAPFDSGDWLAIETTTNSNHHRISDTTSNGRIIIPQRFAGDWHKVEGGGISVDNPAANGDYYCYGENLLAAAAGTVVFVQTGLEDNEPGSVPNGLTLETVPGNCVVIDIGSGKYLQYAHLQEGSVTVAAGQEIATGAIIGKIGNSGNSTAPHLHLQVSDSPEFLGGEGLPFVFDSFTLKAELEPADPLVFPSLFVPTDRTLEIPENRSIVTF
jgi:hypothetical protein